MASSPDSRPAIVEEFSLPLFAVTVCGNGSLFVHTIVSPALTVRSAGWNATASIVTGCFTGFGGAVAAPTADSRPAHTMVMMRESLIAADIYFLAESAACTCFACSRWATNAGRVFTSSALSSSFFAPGIRVLSTASSTAW